MGCGFSTNGTADTKRRRLSVLTVKKGTSADEEVPRGQLRQGSVVDTLLDLLPEGERRFSVVGQQPMAMQQGFENKTTAIAQAKRISDHLQEQQLGPEFGIGYVCKKGLKPESPNQDDFFVLQVDQVCGVYGVFDGHGPCGHDITHFAHQLLPALLLRSDTFAQNPSDALRRAFLKTHQQLAKAQEEGTFDCSLSGTTGTVLLVRDNILYCAHVGDSRAVLALCKKGETSHTAMDLSVDHKPSQENEKTRIHAAGGQVRCLQGDVNYRVFLKNRMYPGLAMSRSIGDLVGASAGVISEPDVNAFPLQQTHKFMIICTDGVWEFISSQEAVDIVAAFSPEEAMQAAETLSQEAWRRWILEEGNVVDDITVIIVHFQSRFSSAERTIPANDCFEGTVNTAQGKGVPENSEAQVSITPGQAQTAQAIE